jgi:formate/nitrite transporter FocA (FNT family)
MKKYISIFLSGVLSGFCITFGATCYLMCLSLGKGGNADLLKVVGSFMFGIGLFTIIHFGFWLYTGKVGYLFNNKPNYLIDLLICFAGNVVGSVVLSFLISLTGQGDALMNVATPLVEAKIDSTWYSIFIMSLMCGAMINLAVEGHKVASYPLGKVLFAFMPIALFIFAGFEHVVANVTYFMYAKYFSWKALGYFVLMFLGNGLGSIIFYELIKFVKKLESSKNNESNDNKLN